MVSTVEIASTAVVPILVFLLVPTVRIRSDWCRPASILPPSTLLVALVDMFQVAVPKAVFVPLIGFPTTAAEIIPIANEQKLSSLVSSS